MNTDDDACLPDLLDAWVRATPERTAVIHGDDRLTYRELARGSESLAAYLHHIGVDIEDCIGLFTEPSLDLMVGVWGILASGAAYLPLSPEYPEQRLRFMIADRRATVIVTQAHLKDRLAQLAPRTATIVTLEDAAAHAHAHAANGRLASAPPSRLRPHNLAYVIYTSGSTGQPKGVMIEHRSVVSQLRWLHAEQALDRDAVVVQKTPMSFDAAQWEILAPACGSTVVMGTAGVHRDPERLIATITRHRVTTLQCVPTLLQALLDTELLHRCTSLRRVFSGGEALSKALAVRCIEALPACTLVNLYGPTECTINASALTVDPRTVRDGPDTVSIGVPVHDTSYHVLDAHRAPVAVGEVGELYIGGIQVARGYSQRPDLTAERFVDHPGRAPRGHERLYRTGDLVYACADGTVQFVGRTDNQVKLRGFRIELDEIRHAIETHDWVRHAAVVVGEARTGSDQLVAFIELNPKEAALMDQGNHGAHHQSKHGRLQAKAQLSNPGCREVAEIAGKPVVELPGRAPTAAQRREVFARKTYRFFEGGDTAKDDILRLLGRDVTGTRSRRVEDLDRAELGAILRFFGQYASDERLLPKYGYASPGALYATQMYLELHGVAGLAAGHYYYHPVRHALVLISPADEGERERGVAPAELKVHFVGRQRAIEPVYKHNIQEVLEIEAGHMVGLFEEILPRHGLNIRPLEFAPPVQRRLQCASDDRYLGTFELVPGALPSARAACDIYVQSHPGRIADLPAGQYHFRDGELVPISDELLAQRHVIAINQQVYERASFAITAVSTGRVDWLRYVDLGRTLQRLSMNGMGLGFMSAGYSSKSGHDLPSAKRIAGILGDCGLRRGPSYFFVGGRVSDEQVRSEGMKEDAVHMKGPTELIRDDLVHLLPEYMMPNRVVVLDALPRSANGKIDARALQRSTAAAAPDDRPPVAPRTFVERRIAAIWQDALKQGTVSVTDDFFESGGDSLTAVALMNRINRELHGASPAHTAAVPVQALFEAPTIERLAARVDAAAARRSPRLVRLHADGVQPPIYCWPGLGGYPLSLRVLARNLDVDRSFYGVQAHGINPGEVPYPTLAEMAAADVRLIRRRQPHGPYALWGYSFGARVAFEAAHQLEQAGEAVQRVVLIAPGLPPVRGGAPSPCAGGPSFADEAYVTILFSVFAGAIEHPALAECLATATDEQRFAEFVSARLAIDDIALVQRIMHIVGVTSQFCFAADELAGRSLRAPITIFSARGDGRSFLEVGGGGARTAPTVVDLRADHYRLLKEPHVGELVAAIRTCLAADAAARRDAVWPIARRRAMKAA